VRGSGYFIWNVPPLSKHKGGLASRLLDTWRVSGTWVAQSGQPYTINTIQDINGDGNATDRLNSVTGLRFGAIGGDRSRQIAIVDPAGLLAPLGRDGAIGRNLNTGDRLSSLDFALSEIIPLQGDDRKLDLRVECYNVANRAAFGVPVRILESPGFGRSVSTVNQPRTIQFALKLHF
jgi:hypothetical protein